MIGAIVLHKVRCFFVLEIAVCAHSHRVAEEFHACVHITHHAHIAHHRSYQTKSGIHIVGQNRAVALGELSAHPHHVLSSIVGHRHTFGYRCQSRFGIKICRNAIYGLGVFSYFVHGISRQTEFRPFLRPFEHIHAKCIGEFPHFGVIVRTVNAQIVGVEILRILRATLVEIHVLVFLIFHRPDEARHRHIFFHLHHGVGQRVGPVAIEAHFVAMIHIEFLAPNLRVCVGKMRGNGLGIHLSHTALHHCRVGDITVVGDAATLLVEHIVVVEKCLQLVAVADI